DVDRLVTELGDGGLAHLPVERRDLGEVEKLVGGEALRGRTGGAVTLAVGMAVVLNDAFSWTGFGIRGVMKYWDHFAIMFEALSILAAIDTGTRIARFLLQEAMGKFHPKLERADWLPGAALATLVVTAGWGLLVETGSIDTIWPMFGIANQLLAVIALCLVTTLLVNTGRAKYAWVTLLPMAFVTVTTMTAASQMIPQFVGFMQRGQWSGLKGGLNIFLMVFVIACVLALLVQAVARWVAVLRGIVPVRREEEPTGNGIAADASLPAVPGTTTP